MTRLTYALPPGVFAVECADGRTIFVEGRDYGDAAELAVKVGQRNANQPLLDTVRRTIDVYEK